MRILSNLFLSGSFFTSNSTIYLSAVSSSEASGSLPENSIGIYWDPNQPDSDRGPGVITDERGPTNFDCATKSVLESSTVSEFYLCLVSGSSSNPFSLDSTTATTTDTTESYYPGATRTNQNTYDESGTQEYIYHTSYILSGSTLVPDFSIQLAPDGYQSTIQVVLRDTMPTDAEIEAQIQRFKDLICNCLQNGQRIVFTFDVLTESSADGSFLGRKQYRIKISRCYGVCLVKYEEIAYPFGAPDTDITGSKPSTIEGYEYEGNAAIFNYTIGYVSGSEPPANGILSAGSYPYLAIPAANAAPADFYPFDDSLEYSPVKHIAGLAYYNTSTSTLSVYDGTSWTAVGGGSLTKVTQTVGNDSTSSFVVTHNKGTRDVMVSVRQTLAPYEFVFPTITASDTNTVTVNFGVEVPSTNEYTVIVI